MADRITEFYSEDCEFIFNYHAPTPEQAAMYEGINKVFVVMAKDLASFMPAGPGKTVAMRKLAEASMACNAAVAMEGRF